MTVFLPNAGALPRHEHVSQSNILDPHTITSRVAKVTYLQITCEQDSSKLARLEDCQKAIAHLNSHPITQECGAWQADHETTMHIDRTCRLKIFADPHWSKECFAVARYLAEVTYTCIRTDPVTHEE